jgi:hypothetical protein
VLVKRHGKYEPVKPTNEAGMAFVDLKAKDVYAVRLINDTDAEAVARVWIDGLEVFSFSQQRQANGRPRHSGHLIPKGKARNLLGWSSKQGKAEEFLVTEYPQAAANRFPFPPTDLGVITVSFAPAWKKGEKPPVVAGAKSVLLGTGFGQHIDAPD